MIETIDVSILKELKNLSSWTEEEWDQRLHHLLHLFEAYVEDYRAGAKHRYQDLRQYARALLHAITEILIESERTMLTMRLTMRSCPRRCCLVGRGKNYS